MKELRYEEIREMLLRCADRIFRCEPYLTKADSAIGDGDHGNGMVNGMTAAKEVLLKEAQDKNIYRLYAEMAQAMQRSMGGASGMIFSALFSGDAKDRAPAQVFTPAMLADQMQAGLRAIMELGHASPGDKTMVDALYPAVQAMQNRKNCDFETMLCAAADAAKRGMEDTKNMTAKYGRAKNLGERALGFMDAGAITTWLMLREMADYVSGETTPDPDPGEIVPVRETQAPGATAAKKLINDPSDAVREEGEGFLAAFGKEIAGVPGVNGFVRRNIPQGKTALLIGGGSGHEPMFGFFLGDNLADAAANGNVFTSPDPVTIAAVAEAADRGAGVLFLYGNYAGDNLNFDKAADMLREKGIETRTVRVKDDVASAERDLFSKYRSYQWAVEYGILNA